MLAALDRLLSEKMREGATDIKTINFIYEALYNPIQNEETAQKIVAETCLMDSLRHLLEVSKHWHTDLL